MKQYSYFLFPVLFRTIGFLGIGISVYLLIFNVEYSKLNEVYQSLVGAIGFGLMGLILTSFKGKISIQKDKMQVIKEYRVFGLKLSADNVKIPANAYQVLIQRKSKKGRGYIQGVVGFGYRLESCDLFFVTDRSTVRIINTEYNRAVIIAELLRETLNFEYQK